MVGYDDTSYVGNGPQGLTTVHQPVHEMGSRAAELLLERIDGGRTESAHEVLPPTLVVRSTSSHVATVCRQATPGQSENFRAVTRSYASV